MGRLNDKIAIVTGAGQGIGRAIAEKLAMEGATVVATDLDEANAQDTATALPGAVAIRADVTDRHSVHVMVSRVVRQFGRIDVLVNNAGWDKASPFIDSDPPTGTARSPSTCMACCTRVKRYCRSWPSRAAERW
jgi:2-hydroxycyclohexanecarboxyl-CoA dehydrogenase